MAKRIHAILILDESSSMSGSEDAIVQLFNDQVEEIIAQSDNGAVDINTSLVKFANEPKEILWEVPHNQLQKITRADYRPFGSTALLDAIGSSVSKLQSQVDFSNKDEYALFVIITDGEENQSKAFTASQVKSIITELEQTGRWQFTIIGKEGGIDLEKLSQRVGVNLGNVAYFGERTMSQGMVGSSMRLSMRDFTSQVKSAQCLSTRYSDGSVIRNLESDLDNGVDFTIDPNGTKI